MLANIRDGVLSYSDLCVQHPEFENLAYSIYCSVYVSADGHHTGWVGKGIAGSDQRERRTETKVRTVVEGKTRTGISTATDRTVVKERTGEPTECGGKRQDFKRKSRHLPQGALTVSESRKKTDSKGNDSYRGTGKRVLEESQTPENGKRGSGTAKKRDGDIYQRSHG